MQLLQTILQEKAAAVIAELYSVQLAPQDVQIASTDPKFAGDFTVVLFPLVKQLRQKPQEIAQKVGEALLAAAPELIAAFNVVAGYCNIVFTDASWLNYLKNSQNAVFAPLADKHKTVVVEYASPNTNKPLHLGHVRNNLLGYATAEILKAAGYGVKKVQIVNDRGIHICKSMLTWKLFGNGETPQTRGLKGDHLVGEYYVLFEQKFQDEYKNWQSSEVAQNLFSTWLNAGDTREKTEKILLKAQQQAAKKAGDDETIITDLVDTDFAKYYFKEVYKNTYFNQYSALGTQAKQMLNDWEDGNAEVLALWNMMNGWVYEGFEVTYKRLGVDFDKLYYESNTYLKGKALVEDNLKAENSIFYQQEDGSIWIDLSDAKLDKKAVLRGDGTSMYITQDLGTALLRFEDFDMDKMIYVVGNEQEYHFQVLFEILKRLGYKFSDACYHLSYGMVNLTTGKMKSREGTVVDADDLMQELITAVETNSAERNSLDGLTAEENAKICYEVALAALKFYILKVEPSKTMIFDPTQSIDLQGQTGPYIQNAHVRTCGVARKLAQSGFVSSADFATHTLQAQEKEVLQLLHALPTVIEKAAETYNPAELGNYLYNLARAYHRFYNDLKIIDLSQPEATTNFRIALSERVQKTLRYAGGLLGIAMPEKM
jgi:arginyl-tRNA synthetase